MAILAVVLGGGLGLFAALDVEERAALGVLKSVLRSAENGAIARQAPARVRIDAARGTLWAEGWRVVGTWRFDARAAEPGEGAGTGSRASPLVGAFDLELAGEHPRFVEGGALGEALALGVRADGVLSASVQHDPAWNLRAGFELSCAIWRAGSGGGRLVRLGEVVALEVGGAGELRGRFTPAIEQQGVERPGAQVALRSAPGVVPDERWTDVALRYDRLQLELLVDGLVVARRAEDAPVWRLGGPLALSDERLGFPGAIDDLVVAVLEAGETQALPEGVRFGAGTPALVHFAAGGGLDRREHADAVRLALEHADGKRETIEVGVFGTVE
jgi:hypothetical protein